MHCASHLACCFLATHASDMEHEWEICMQPVLMLPQLNSKLT